MANAILAVIIGTLIIILETLRVRRLIYMDFLRLFSFAFVMVYVYVPVVMNGLGVEGDERSFWFSFIPYSDPTWSVPAQIVALMFYLSTRLGFELAKRAVMIKRLAITVEKAITRIPPGLWFLVALSLSTFSALSLILYVQRRGADILYLIEVSGQLRVGRNVAGVEDTSFTFLTLAMYSITSSFVILGLLQRELAKRRLAFALVLSCIFLLNVGITLVVLIMRAGRLHILNFLLVLLFVLTYKGSRMRRLVVVSGSFLLAILTTLTGKSLLGISHAAPVVSGWEGLFGDIARELAFPYLSLVHAVVSVNAADYRWFIDAPLAVLYVVGVPLSVILTGAPLELPLSVAKVNTVGILGTTALGEIPVDLVTCGYYSGGVVGVLMSALIFGAMLAFLEAAFPAKQGVMGVLRWAWIIFASTVGFLYADPVNVFRDGQYLIVPTMLVVVLGMLLPRFQRGEARHLG